MKKFMVYQQFPPIQTGTDQDSETGESVPVYSSQIVPVGYVEARTGGEAIDLARRWTRFQITSGLARFPIVQEARHDGA